MPSASLPFAALALSGLALVARGQLTGEYCGSYLGGLARVKVNVADASHLDIDMNIFGTDLNCPGEPFALDAATGLIKLTQEEQPSDCLKTGFAKRGQDPSSIGLTFDKEADAIRLVVSGIPTNLTHGSCKLGAAPSSPSGKYCGAYLGGLAKVKVGVVDASHMDIDMNIFGTDLNCPGEPFSLDASTGVIKLTQEDQPSDCLKTGFAKRGQDPKSVGLTYDAAAESIHLSVSGVGTDLTHAHCQNGTSSGAIIV